MASKFGLAGGIPERRVRPIWDAVDSRQFKHALKLALLAKYPNYPYVLFDERMSSALSFVEKLQMEITTDYVRCLYLAPIEIERQHRLNGNVNDGKLLEALLNYFHRFGHLFCFTSDMEMFLHALTDGEKADILEMFEKSSQSPLASPLRTFGRDITLFKVRELVGVNATLHVVGIGWKKRHGRFVCEEQIWSMLLGDGNGAPTPAIWSESRKIQFHLRNSCNSQHLQIFQ